MHTTFARTSCAIAALFFAALPALSDDKIVSLYAAALDRWAYSLGERDKCYDSNSRDQIETEARLASEVIAPDVIADLFGDRETARRYLRGPATGKYWEGRMSQDACLMVLLLEESRREIVLSYRDLMTND